MSFSFANPFMLLLLALPFAAWLALPAAKEGAGGAALRVPFLAQLRGIPEGGFGGARKGRFSKNFWKAFAVFSLLVLALSRPQAAGEPIRVHSSGRDILLAADISTSMTQPDFALQGRRITRLDAVKATAHRFIEDRRGDRVGLILFGTRAYLQAPITFDRAAVQEVLLAAQAGMAGNSTSIGDALGLALKYLRNSPDTDKKAIILLTDGESNDGALGVAQAISLAKEEGVKIYTIGVGSDDIFSTMLGGGLGLGNGDGLDEETLKRIAEDTHGEYFRARDAGDLARAYARIDELEPAAGEDNFVQEASDLFYIPLLAALALAATFLARRRGR